jgi:uroporphyrinogen decarboxylase
MNSYERVMTALSHKEPDRVPIFLFLTLHGAKELNLSIQEYFSKSDNVVEGQLKLLAKFGHDCVYPFFYASKEVEAFGGTTIFYENGPPNSGAPVIGNIESIEQLICPDPFECEALREPLRAIKLLAKEKKGQVPIVSAMISPFSLPSMLLGLEQWLDLLLFGDTKTRDKLLDVMKSFSVGWANAQFEAGADAIGFFDPLATSDVMTREQFQSFDFKLAADTIQKIKGPVVYAGAGGRFEHILDLIPKTGAIGVIVSSHDSLIKSKKCVGDKINIFGNLNNIEIANWTAKKTTEEVKRCIEQGAQGGGFILADQHGELPFCVHDKTLHTLVKTAWKVGKYGNRDKASSE